MQDVLYLTWTGNFYFWILLPGREIYFLRLVITLPQSHKKNPFKVAYTGPLFLCFTTALCSESDGGSTSNVLMLMLYWSEKMIRNFMYWPPNTRLIHKTNNRFTLTTVFCFRVDPPPSLLWRHMKPKNRKTSLNLIKLFSVNKVSSIEPVTQDQYSPYWTSRENILEQNCI
jgi:hypothetical protein